MTGGMTGGMAGGMAGELAEGPAGRTDRRAVRYYVDHNATTPADPRVLEHFEAVERDCPGNPASLHAEGRRARAVLEEARVRVATALGAEPDDVLFTSGGTEANNCAVLGLGDPGLPVLCAAVEHPSVLEPARARGTLGWAVDRDGRALVEAPHGPPGLLCLVHAQGEVGTIQPVVAAAELANDLRVPLHVDAAQSLGRIALDDVVARADSFSLSPHKAGGLRGSGVLVVREAPKRLRPLLRGGGQESGLRAGTVSCALAAAAALAIELAVAERASRSARMARARAAFLTALAEAPVQVLTPLDASVPNTVLLEVDGIDGRNLLPALDLDGLAASQGAACSSGAPRPPLVLSAMGLEDARARTCVRVSFGRDDDEAFATAAGAALAATIERLRKKN